MMQSLQCTYAEKKKKKKEQILNTNTCIFMSSSIYNEGRKHSGILSFFQETLVFMSCLYACVQGKFQVLKTDSRDKQFIYSKHWVI